MEIFKFEIEREDRTIEKGYFFRTAQNEISGVIEGEQGNIQAFIKGLFLNEKQLIFVKMTKEKHYKSGYAFKDVNNQVGVFDEYDWLSGVFSGEAVMEPITLKMLCKQKSRVIRKSVKKEFIKFYRNLDCFDKHYFDNVQNLKECFKYI